MHSLIELWESVRDFIATGGSVLYIVAFVLFAMWVLIIERFWFVTRDYPVLRSKIVLSHFTTALKKRLPVMSCNQST